MPKSNTISTCYCGATLDWLTQEMTLSCGEPCSFVMGKSGGGQPPLPTQEFIEGYCAARKEDQPKEEKNTHWLVLSDDGWLAFDNKDSATDAHCANIELRLRSYLIRGETVDASGDDLEYALIRTEEANANGKD